MPALHVIIAPAFLAALGTLELGVCHRLAEAAWISDPVAVLPAEDSFLAAVARITPSEWSAHGPAALRALGSAPHGHAPGSAHDPACGAAGHLVLQAVRSAFDATAANVAAKEARAAELSAKRREAGRAGAVSRWQTDGKPMAIAMALPSAAPSLRSSSPQVLSAPAPTLQPERKNQSAQEDVVAVLGERARALLSDKVDDWRRSKALGMLQQAISRWRESGLTSCPIGKASEIARGANVTPARVEYLIQDADAKILDARARGESCNPVGVVISGLGQSTTRRRPPVEVPIFVEEAWSKREAMTLSALEAQAAINARVRETQSQLTAIRARQGGGAGPHALGAS